MSHNSSSLARVLLVTGSRTIRDEVVVNTVLDQVFDQLKPTLLIHGGAVGVDQIAGAWAAQRKLDVRVVRPNFGMWPRAAFGPGKAYAMRDLAMVAEATHVVGIWDGTSKGTHLTLKEAKRVKKLVSVWNEKGHKREF